MTRYTIKEGIKCRNGKDNDKDNGKCKDWYNDKNDGNDTNKDKDRKIR